MVASRPGGISSELPLQQQWDPALAGEEAKEAAEARGCSEALTFLTSLLEESGEGSKAER